MSTKKKRAGNDCFTLVLITGVLIALYLWSQK